MSLDPMPDAATLLRMKAERERRTSGYSRVEGTPPTPPTTLTTTAATTWSPDTPLAYYRGAAPITLRIPWSALVSDNVKLRAARRGESATVVLTPEYRQARDRIKKLCAETMGDRPAFDGPLSLVARVWVPNKQRRDVVNFSKALHDAMNGTIYLDDSQLHDVRWVRAGIDIDAPRCDLTLTPLTPEP